VPEVVRRKQGPHAQWGGPPGVNKKRNVPARRLPLRGALGLEFQCGSGGIHLGMGHPYSAPHPLAVCERVISGRVMGTTLMAPASHEVASFTRLVI
jgi:hypothetical protein